MSLADQAVFCKHITNPSDQEWALALHLSEQVPYRQDSTKRDIKQHWWTTTLFEKSTGPEEIGFQVWPSDQEWAFALHQSEQVPLAKRDQPNTFKDFRWLASHQNSPTAPERGVNTSFKVFRTDNGSSPGQNLSLTVLCVPDSLDSGLVNACEPPPRPRGEGGASEGFDLISKHFIDSAQEKLLHSTIFISNIKVNLW